MDKKIDEQLIEMINRHADYVKSEYLYNSGKEHPSIVNANWEIFVDAFRVLTSLIEELEKTGNNSSQMSPGQLYMLYHDEHGPLTLRVASKENAKEILRGLSRGNLFKAYLQKVEPETGHILTEELDF